MTHPGDLAARIQRAVLAVKGGIGCQEAAKLHEVRQSLLERHCSARDVVTTFDLEFLDRQARADFKMMLDRRFPRAEAFGYAFKDMRMRERREARRCA